jgi:hypothetical protein
MSRNRNPIEVTKATGHDRDKKRYAGRTEFSDDENPPLGKPERCTPHREAALWEKFKREWPWLRESDRAAIECLVVMRAKLDATCGEKFFKQYMDALKAFGGTPGERTKMPKVTDNANTVDGDGSEYLN